MADLPSVNIAEIENFKRISDSSADTSVFMLNLNRYSEEAGYPEGTLYKKYTGSSADESELFHQDLRIALVNGGIYWVEILDSSFWYQMKEKQHSLIG